MKIEKLKSGYCIVDDTKTAKYGEYSVTTNGIIKKYTENSNFLWKDGCHPVVIREDTLDRIIKLKFRDTLRSFCNHLVFLEDGMYDICMDQEKVINDFLQNL